MSLINMLRASLYLNQ